jgi:hypothetical protein
VLKQRAVHYPELVQQDVVIEILKVPEVYLLAIITKVFSDFLHRGS